MIRSDAAHSAPYIIRRLLALAPFLGLSAVCVVAFHHGRSSTAGLSWPINVFDFYRDMGFAQSILDGAYPADSNLRGETVWYNPLYPSVMAAVAKVSGMPMPVLGAQLAAFVNLLLPISFFLMVSMLFDNWVAIAATALFVFGNATQLNMDLSVTYTPRPWIPFFAQIPFFLTCAVYCWAVRSRKKAAYVLAGIGLGCTFLAHTAPALVLGFIFVVETASQIRRNDLVGSALSSLTRFAILIIAAFVVSLPFTYSILFRYHLAVLAKSTLRYTIPPVELARLPHLLSCALTPYMGLVVAGLILVMMVPRRRGTRILLLGWCLASLVFLTQSYACDVLDPQGTYLTQPCPRHHFFVNASALMPLLAGNCLVAISSVLVLIWDRLSRRKREHAAATITPLALSSIDHPASRLAVLVLLALLLACWYPAYGSSRHFASCAPTPEDLKEQAVIKPVYEWLLENTAPDDVMLSDDLLTLETVIPSGRKMISTWPMFMNPYVSDYVLSCVKEGMFDALEKGDESEFLRLCREYSVTYIIARDQLRRVLETAGFGTLREVAVLGPVTIHRLNTQ